ncbi:MAG: selenocysteine-specific translation elongation factor [Candidatus Anammoxibacter sp.]
MKNIIIGTAGHIDHGKTALVKALTGIDADRLPEEKARGLTIDIGFAFFDLDENIRVNFIDVPGHERFIKNMLAGATSIDAALFVIAADDGIMPQTREHLEILDLLEIGNIIVVITKCDLVDEDWLEMLKEEIQDLINETGFKDARILSVSTINNKGIAELKSAMKDLVSDVNRNNDRETFRLPIDRAFTISGFGCVVTGSVLGGRINVNDEVELLPMKTIARIRGIEVNGEKKDNASAGQRAAINLAGVKAADVYRGCELLKPGYLEPVSMVDCELYLHHDTKKNLTNRTRIRFHIFTNEIMGRVILLDKEVLKPGESGLVQIRLEKPVVAEKNDRYIIRSYSPAYTIGGGRVLRSNTRFVKRFKNEVLESLKTIASDNIAEITELTFVESNAYCLSTKDVQTALNLPELQVENVIKKLVDTGKLFVFGESAHSNMRFVHFKQLEKLQKQAEEYLKQFHKENPLRTGMEDNLLRLKLGKGLPGEVFSLLISKLIASKNIRVTQNKVSLYSFKINMSDTNIQKLESLEAAIIKDGFAPPSVDELIIKTDGEEKHIASLLNYLVETGRAVEVNRKLFYHNNVIEQLKELISNHIKKHASISAAEFRDITNTSRKYAIPLLEYFDKVRFTKRTGDKRILASSN